MHTRTHQLHGQWDPSGSAPALMMEVLPLRHKHTHSKTCEGLAALTDSRAERSRARSWSVSWWLRSRRPATSASALCSSASVRARCPRACTHTASQGQCYNICFHTLGAPGPAHTQPARASATKYAAFTAKLHLYTEQAVMAQGVPSAPHRAKRSSPE